MCAHVATAVPVPVSVTLLTEPAWPAADVQLTWDQVVLVNLLGMLLLKKYKNRNKIMSYKQYDITYRNDSVIFCNPGHSPKRGCRSMSCSWGNSLSSGLGSAPGGYGNRARGGPPANGSTRGWGPEPEKG